MSSNHYTGEHYGEAESVPATRRSARLPKQRTFGPNEVQYTDDMLADEVEDEPEIGIDAEYTTSNVEPTPQVKQKRVTSNMRAAREDSDDDFQISADEIVVNGSENGSIYAPSRASSPVSEAHSPPAGQVYHSQHAMPQQQQQQQPQQLSAGYASHYGHSGVAPHDLYGQPPPREPASGPSRSPAKPRAKAHTKKVVDPDRPKRPPNSFILYRSFACSAGIIPASLRINDHRQISRIVATMWKELPADERAVWEGRAQEAKRQHELEHPGYRYAPASKKCGKPAAKRQPKKKKNGSEEDASGETEEQMKERRRCEAVARVLLKNKKDKSGGAPEVVAADGEELRTKVMTAVKDTATAIAEEKKQDDELRAQGIEPPSRIAAKPKKTKPATAPRRTTRPRRNTRASSEETELADGNTWEEEEETAYDPGYHQYHSLPITSAPLPLPGNTHPHLPHYNNYGSMSYQGGERHYGMEHQQHGAYPPRRDSVYFREALDNYTSAGPSSAGLSLRHITSPYQLDSPYMQSHHNVQPMQSQDRSGTTTDHHDRGTTSPPAGNWKQTEEYQRSPTMGSGYPNPSHYQQYRMSPGHYPTASQPFQPSIIPAVQPNQQTWYAEDRLG